MSDTTVVRTPEQRSETRRSLTRKPRGQFSIRIGEREIDVIEVQDVSSSGIRVRVEATIGVSTPIMLHYRNSRIELDLNGITCWEAPADGPSGPVHVVGIDLLSPTTLLNLV